MSDLMLLSIIDELEQHNAVQSKTFEKSVEQRLEYALNQYYNEMQASFNALIAKNARKVLKVANEGRDIECQN